MVVKLGGPRDAVAVSSFPCLRSPEVYNVKSCSVVPGETRINNAVRDSVYGAETRYDRVDRRAAPVSGGRARPEIYFYRKFALYSSRIIRMHASS